MEKIVHGNIDPKATAMLLRALQIANSTLASGVPRAAQAKAR
jgi:hypothetical protein